MSKTFDDMVDALETIADAVDSGDQVIVSFAVDDYNMLCGIIESLDNIANALNKIEAKIP